MAARVEAAVVMVAAVAVLLVDALVDQDPLLVTERYAQQRETVEG